jgi:hypothetical protein
MLTHFRFIAAGEIGGTLPKTAALMSLLNKKENTKE